MIKKLDIVKNGILRNNPAFRLALGACPTLAVTTSAINGLSMGLATTFVLLCSNILVSLLRNIIPDKVRIPAYILVIATFVIVVEMVLKAFLPEINQALGLFISLIVVNCVILGRAESFASANPVGLSTLDAIGIGAGFTFALTLIGFVREILGAGTIGSLVIPGLSNVAMTIFILPAGGFFAYGFLMVIFNMFIKKADERKKQKAASAKGGE